MTSTGMTRAPNCSQSSMPGHWKLGSPAGRWPITAPPASAKPVSQLMNPLRPMMKMAEGKAGRHFLASISKAMLTRP